MLETPNPPLNRYAKKRKHKWELKKRHTKGPYNDVRSPKTDENKNAGGLRRRSAWKMGGCSEQWLHLLAYLLSLRPQKDCKAGDQQKDPGDVQECSFIGRP